MEANIANTNIAQMLVFALVMLVAGVALLFVFLGRPTPMALAPAPAPAPAPADVRAYIPESWCLMSEDALGRWCSPNIPNCPAHRFYTSRDACELVDASSMPLNIVTGEHNGRLKTLPLARAALLGV